MFRTNRQSIDGVAASLASIRGWESQSRRGADIVLLPVAMRIENAELERLVAARDYARKRVLAYLPKGIADPRDYWDRMEVGYRPYYAYGEVLAAFADAPGATVYSLLGDMVRLAEAVADPRATVSQAGALRVPEVSPGDREEVLRLYAFGGSDG